MKYKNLTIIGTSHIAKESISAVTHSIKADKPDIVALELDHKRLYGLLHPGKKDHLYAMKKVGFKGFLFSLIGEWAEKKMGKMVGVKPGTEMLTAFHLAKENNAEVVLIDQDIEITLRRFSKSLSWREKFNFVADIVKAPFSKKKIKFDLNKVPSQELINQLILEVKNRYPNVYNVLIQERNEVMAKRLYNLVRENKKILAVVGAGHEEELIELIKMLERKSIVL
jgi:pheromone shutdown-related protein TraB